MDTGKLIGMVRDRSALWDLRDKNYQMRNVQQRLWNEIAENLGSDVESVRSKWRNLRDTFRRRHREVTQGKSGDGTSSDCTWSFYKSLLFLASSMKEKPVKRERPRPPSSTFKRLRSPDRPYTHSLADENHAAGDSMKHDSDHSFLVSLYPYLRDTPADRKLHVRTRLQEVFILEQELQEGDAVSRGQSPKEQYQSSDQHPSQMMQRHYNHPEAKNSTEPPPQGLVNQQRLAMHSFY